MEDNSIWVKPKVYNKQVSVPGSKSYANRLLILGALSKDEMVLKNMPKSQDVLCLLACLEKVGLRIVWDGDRVLIKNSFPQCEKNFDGLLTPGEGGTTTRFLIPLLARGSKTYHLKLSKQMIQRPMEELYTSLKELGVELKLRGDVLSLKGPLKIPNKLAINGHKSTQFASSLALALADQPSEVTLKNHQFSYTYFKLTQSLIELFKKGQREVTVPVDFSSLSYPFTLGLVREGIKINHLNKIDPFQADAKILDIFADHICFGNDHLKVKKAWGLRPLKLDCSTYLDLVPTLCFICSHIEGVSLLQNLKGLLYKETNRLKELASMLDLFGVKNKIGEDYSLKIQGPIRPKSVIYHSPQDHRMAMTAFLFMKAGVGGRIHNAFCVNKSFPGFYQIWQ
jgi:3-phosphoshikimate 1-carboxyvinyltransferase